jgi:hypothetical protein
MKATFLLPLLMLIGAAPATQPVERLIVQIRHVEYTPKRDQPELDLASAKMEIPDDAKDLSSLRVLAEPGAPFETVAVVNGTSYSLTGKLTRPNKATDGKVYVRVEFDYLESAGSDQKSITQIKSNVMLEVDQEVRMGGMMRGTKATGLILSLKRPEVTPAR